MDSSIPPPPRPSSSVGLRKLRPWYLMPAMLLAWCIGVREFQVGLSGIASLRSGRIPDVATAARNAEGSFDLPELAQLFNASALEAMQRSYRVMMPICIAQLLLGGLLVVASGMAMSSRRDARGLAIQALVANTALAFVTYMLTRGVRGAAIEAVVRAASALPLDLPQRSTFSMREALWWWSRVISACQMGLLGVGVIALTRPRTKAYFDALARVTDRAGEP